MKRYISILLICVSFIIIYILQANFFSWFTIAGIKPNLFIIFIVFLGLFGGRYMGLVSGILSGILLDVFIGKNIGISAVMLGIIGFIAGVLDKNFSKDSKITIILIIMITTICYEVGSFFINTIIFSYEVIVWNFIKRLLVEVLYNAILTIIIYPIIQKTGFALEEIYKENKILTRYF